MTNRNPEIDSTSFDLFIGRRTESSYPITVTASPAGNASDWLDIDTSDLELLDALDFVAAGEAEAEFLRGLGDFFFQQLFRNGIRDVYRASLAIVREQERGLSLRFYIEPSEIQALPWEYLFDAQEDRFLAIAAETPLVRHIPMQLPVRTSRVTLPLRILAIISAPNDAPALDAKQEIEKLNAALEEPIRDGAFELTVLEDGKLPSIIDVIERVKPHVVHFIGHGMFDGEQAYVLLEDDDGRTKPLNDLMFRELFTSTTTVRLVVLNACESGALSSAQAISGMAPRLLQRQVSAVVAMQFPIQDEAAIMFTRRFYAALANGDPIDAAVALARREIYLSLGADQADWGVPIVFLRAANGQIFTIEQAPALPEAALPPPPQPVRPPPIERLVGREDELRYYTEQLQTTNLAVIAGMPGIGKTSVAAMLAGRVGNERTTFWHSFRTGEGLEVLVQKLAGFLYWNDQPELWQMLKGIEQGGGRLPPVDVLFDYLFQMLWRRGYLLCLDDFDEVDSDPLLQELTDRLLIALQEGKLSIIITSRRIPDFVSLADFKALVGLSFADAKRLLAGRGLDLPADLVNELYVSTEGNAEFFIIALNALERAAEPKRLIARLVETDDIERYLLKELDESLSDLERAIETVVALLGQASVRQVIERTLAEGDLRRSLYDLSERFLLTVYDAQGRRMYDQHAILRAFYREMHFGDTARTMHRRAAEYFEQEEQEWLRAAQQYLAAGEDERAAELATQHVWTIINSGQARMLCTLLEQFAGAKLPAGLWIDVQIAKGEVYSLLGETFLAQESLNEAYGQLTDLDDADANRRRRARICQAMGQLVQFHSPQEALSWLARGLDEFDDETQAANQPLSGEDRTLMAGIRVIMARIQDALGNYETARRLLDDALRILPNGPSHIRARALLNLGNVCAAQGQSEPAQAAYEAALDISERLHDHFLRTKLLANLGIDKETAGDWAGALENYRQALALAEAQGNVVEQARIKNSLGILLTKQGEDEEAHTVLAASIALARRHDLAEDLLYGLTSLADLLIQQRQGEKARPVLQEAEQLAQTSGVRYPLVSVHYGYAQVYLADEQLVAALEHAENAVRVARELGVRDQEAIALRVLGRVLGEMGELDRSLASFAASLQCLNGHDPYETARTQAAWGRELVNNGDGPSGTGLLEMARLTFEALGAKRDLAVS